MNARIEPTVEYGGSCHTYFMVPKEAMRAATKRSYLEYVSEFEIADGVQLEKHRHNTHEFYYILRGRATVQVEQDKRTVEPGDLIHIPPDALHSIASVEGSGPVRGLAFAVSFMPVGGAGSEAEPSEFPV
jgi:mannose-6-phosphate isomerase-like protein (cupin superfamily)